MRAADGSVVNSWHEIGRPQVHGYDLIDVTFLDPLKFVSIADEKVARVFEAPRGFLDMAKGLGISDLKSDEVQCPLYLPRHIFDFNSHQNERPIGASVPPLGLSNKALTNGKSCVALSSVVLRIQPSILSELSSWSKLA